MDSKTQNNLIQNPNPKLAEIKEMHLGIINTEEDSLVATVYSYYTKGILKIQNQYKKSGVKEYIKKISKENQDKMYDNLVSIYIGKEDILKSESDKVVWTYKINPTDLETEEYSCRTRLIQNGYIESISVMLKEIAKEIEDNKGTITLCNKQNKIS